MLAVTALWAILVRELIPHFQLSKWLVTSVSIGVFALAFWLADKASPLRDSLPEEDARILRQLRAEIGVLADFLARRPHG